MSTRKGVPISTSTSPGKRTCPRIVYTLVPGQVGVPKERNQAAPRRRMSGTLARVSTLFTTVGFPQRPWVTG